MSCCSPVAHVATSRDVISMELNRVVCVVSLSYSIFSDVTQNYEVHVML